MTPLELLAQLNWVDWAVLLLVLAYAVAGVVRGLLWGSLDLAGGVATLAVAALGYRYAADLIQRVADVPRMLATVGGFLALMVLAQVVYVALVHGLLGPRRPLPEPLATLDRALGAIPGLVKGALLVTFILLPFALFPLVPSVSAAIERSALASRMVAAVVATTPEVEALMGRDLGESLSFLSPPQGEEGTELHFGALGELTPDPEAEAEMLALVNREREQAGLQPLQADEPLRDVARAHSLEMFQLGYFSHTSPLTGTPGDRLHSAGILFLTAGENLAYAPSVRLGHDGLMRSPGHRANILHPDFGRVGIGVLRSQIRGSMFTQEFAN